MKKVMIVDDSLMIRINLKKAFEQNGFEVVAQAANGREAVDKYKDFAPDFVTMDITMPEMDGITALELIRAHDPNACVIMITALGQELKVLDAIERGARHYIVKPFKEKDVIEKIQEIMLSDEREILHA